VSNAEYPFFPNIAAAINRQPEQKSTREKLTICYLAGTAGQLFRAGDDEIERFLQLESAAKSMRKRDANFVGRLCDEQAPPLLIPTGIRP
jgi:hypothetical protein